MNQQLIHSFARLELIVLKLARDIQSIQSSFGGKGEERMEESNIQHHSDLKPEQTFWQRSKAPEPNEKKKLYLNISYQDAKFMLLLFRDLKRGNFLFEEIRVPLAICKRFREICTPYQLGRELHLVYQTWSKLRTSWKIKYQQDVEKVAKQDTYANHVAMEETMKQIYQKQMEQQSYERTQQEQEQQLQFREHHCAKLMSNGLNNHTRYVKTQKKKEETCGPTLVHIGAPFLRQHLLQRSKK
jgi:hypothetical protein